MLAIRLTISCAGMLSAVQPVCAPPDANTPLQPSHSKIRPCPTFLGPKAIFNVLPNSPLPLLPAAGLRNLFENPAAAQFNHRTLALTTLASVAAFWRYGTKIPGLPAPTRVLMHALLATTCAQVGLGVATLLTYVPVSLGTAHQAGALTLFTIMLGLLYSIKPAPGLRPFRLLLHKWATPAAVAAVAGVGGAVTQMQ
jgi:heme A synthase